jgi:hypothetical protein
LNNFQFLNSVRSSLSLLTAPNTVSPVSHYLWLTQPFSLTVFAFWHRVEEEVLWFNVFVRLSRRQSLSFGLRQQAHEICLSRPRPIILVLY